ncbi:MAG TPA: CopG family transcriptional regulator [Ramlibacter sp.]|uniref:CopG family transcriptional regulator n=1 Tax=Ramlibacter sp. TaxID=1917967 RepID=UPI002D5D5DB4|nr:CopG family transcriptional regulator [Ramlibacter sp.]HZY19548.1 CopG family transcriptional regulator [Ramlibacter sp.]
METKTARLTVLIDPAKKEAFESLCYSQDMTPSQVMRRLIRDFIAQHAPVQVQAPGARKVAAPRAVVRKRG